MIKEINTKLKCDDCNSLHGKKMYCPYDLEINDTKTEVCLCDECAQTRWENT